jgi:hypothetical protein
MGNADSRAHTFDGDVIEATREVPQQGNLPFVGGREIRVTALGAVRQILRTIPGEKGFPQRGSRRQHADGASRDRNSFVEGHEIVAV